MPAAVIPRPLPPGKMINDEYLIECKLDPEDPYRQNSGAAVDLPPKVDSRDPRGINQHLKVTKRAME